LVQRDSVRILASKPDYNQYCFFVAGTVGHMATELAIDFYSMSGPSVGQLLATSEACGRGLQKTNIVKDFRKDLARGVSYLPDEWLRQAAYQPLELAGAPAGWRRMVIGDVLQELRDATQYVLALPYEAEGYRVASLLCLFPAYQTLLRAAEQANKLFTADHNFKISRFTMMTCIRDARSLVHDNRAVLEYCQAAEGAIDSLLNQP
jgi:farnesyl-diphosphate farnesyltransferase